MPMQPRRSTPSLLPPALMVSALLLGPLTAQATSLTALPGVTASASSCYTGCGHAAYDASNIIDGDWGQTGNTGLNSWNAGYAGGWVQLDFGAAYVLDRIELYGNSPYYNPFTLTASVDGQTWAALTVGGYAVEPLLSAAGAGGIRYGAVYDVTLGGSHALPANVPARYLRYTVGNGSPQWGYLFELQAQGHLAAVPEPASAAMSAAGLGLLGWLARRRRKA